MAGVELEAFVFPSPDNRANYRGAIDPMDGRYEDPETQKYFSEEARVGYQAYVEAALAHTYADFGLCTREVAIEIERAGREVSLDEVEAREKGRGEFKGTATGHDVVGLTDAISSRISDEAKPWVHAAATSYDPVSTAMSLQYRDGVNGLIIPRLITLGDTIADITERHADTPQVGRTHGQHGVPISFGFATSRYLGRLSGSIVQLDSRVGELQGKFSGAVGGYNASSLINPDPIAFEKAFLDKLGLQVCDYATQIVPGENMLRLLNELGISSGVMAQIGEDMRNLQRSEIAEVGEHFDTENQRGSSAMVQKRNPITFENAAGIHREVLAQLFNAGQNMVSDHQRDLRDSVSMRFYGLIPAMVGHTAKGLTRAMASLEVNEGKMLENLYMSGGAIASEALQTVLRSRGDSKAYVTAKKVVNDSMKSGKSFREEVASHPLTEPVLAVVEPHQRAAIVSPEMNYRGLTASEARRHVAVWHAATDERN